MVKYVNSKEKKPGIVYLELNSLDDIKKSEYPKVVLKFSTSTCPPCRNLQRWLKEDFKPAGIIPMFEIVLDDKSNLPEKSEAIDNLQILFNISSVPVLAVVDKSLDTSKSEVIKGFNPEKISELLNKHFSN